MLLDHRLISARQVHYSMISCMTTCYFTTDWQSMFSCITKQELILVDIEPKVIIHLVCPKLKDIFLGGFLHLFLIFMYHRYLYVSMTGMLRDLKTRIFWFSHSSRSTLLLLPPPQDSLSGCLVRCTNHFPGYHSYQIFRKIFRFSCIAIRPTCQVFQENCKVGERTDLKSRIYGSSDIALIFKVVSKSDTIASMLIALQSYNDLESRIALIFQVIFLRQSEERNTGYSHQIIIYSATLVSKSDTIVSLRIALQSYNGIDSIVT